MSNETPYSLRCGLTIYPSQERAVDQALKELYARCPAQFILLADQSGQLMTVHGDRGEMDIVSLATLVAADIAASQEIARLSGQYDNYQLVLREGQHSYFFIVECGKYLVLFVQLSHDVPMGWARMNVLHTAASVTEMVALRTDRIEKDLELDFGSPDSLTDLFGDAFDKIWTEKKDEY